MTSKTQKRIAKKVSAAGDVNPIRTEFFQNSVKAIGSVAGFNRHYGRIYRAVFLNGRYYIYSLVYRRLYAI